MKGLDKSFKERKSWINKRSSTIFPFFSSSKTNHFIVFQNYWSWKGNINKNQIICKISVFNSIDPNPIDSKEFNIQNHNCIDLNKEFGISIIKKDDLHMPSSIEVEFLAKENIGYPFPGIVFFCVQKDTGEVTCVHSGGRRLNDNEDSSIKDCTETNWLATESEIFTPFFHVFNDSQKNQNESFSKIEVKINISSNPKEKFSTTFKHPNSIYGSKIYYINKIFKEEVLNKIKNKAIWIEINLKTRTFPRMIVGNYDIHQDFHYITHTFTKIDFSDYVRPNFSGETTSYLPLINSSPLKLDARSYPTNAPATIKAESRKFQPASKKNVKSNLIEFKTRGDAITFFENYSKSLKLYEIKSKCPARLNVSYNYKLENSRHPTDIATGFRSRDYPLKQSHWGHGVCNKEFNTILFIINLSNNQKNVFESSFNLDVEFFNKDSFFTKTILIPSLGWNYIEISSKEFPEKNNDFFSWRFKDSYSKNLTTFWISHNTKTGAICGEHGF